MHGFGKSSGGVVHLDSPRSINTETNKPITMLTGGVVSKSKDGSVTSRGSLKSKGLFGMKSTYVCVGIMICFLVILQFRYNSTKKQKIAEMGFQNWYFANSTKTLFERENHVTGGDVISGHSIRAMAKSIGPEFPRSTRNIAKLQN